MAGGVVTDGAARGGGGHPYFSWCTAPRLLISLLPCWLASVHHSSASTSPPPPPTVAATRSSSTTVAAAVLVATVAINRCITT